MALDRVAPHSPETEAVTIGVGIAGGEGVLAEIIDRLDEADFYSPAYRQMFHSLRDMYGRGVGADVVTLCADLHDRGELRSVGGATKVTQLVEAASGCGYKVKEYCSRLRHMAQKRALIRQCIVTMEQAHEPGAEFGDICGRLQAEMFDLVDRDASGGFVHIADYVAPTLEVIEQSVKTRTVTGLATGFPDFDQTTNGLQPGDMIVVAAQTSIGKTAFALNVAEHVLRELELPVGIFSLEMTRLQLIQRMMSARSGENLAQLRRRRDRVRRFSRLSGMAPALAKLPLWIDDTPTLNTLQMRARAKSLKQKKGLALVIVDYLQLVAPATKTDNQTEAISCVSRAVKQMAKELCVPVIALSQFNRKVTEGSSPQLSHLRGSGSIEQDSDVVVFLDREKNKEETRLIVAKQRNGPLGHCNLIFNAGAVRFENVAGKEVTKQEEMKL